MVGKIVQIAAFLPWHKDNCFLMSHTKSNKVYPDQTAPYELSDLGILYMQKTTQIVTRVEWVNEFKWMLKRIVQFVYTVKPQKTEIKCVTKIGFDRHEIAKCSMIALQNASIGAFCNAGMLHLSLKCGENTKNHIFEISVFRGFTVPDFGRGWKIFWKSLSCRRGALYIRYLLQRLVSRTL